MTQYGWKFRVRSADFDEAVQAALFRREADGTTIVAKPLVLEKIDSGTLIDEPTVAVTRDEIHDGRDMLQAIVDGLWDYGYRPSDWEDAAPVLGATERHLEDMRSIVSVKLNVPLSETKGPK